jgi:hypothetical protein
MTPAKHRPPHSVRVLHKWIDDHAKETGGAVTRTQRWISFMVIATILDGVRDEDDDPVFVLKGGAAMELRLGLNARATKDYDVTFRDRTADMLARLDEALQRPHADFAITRTEPVQVGETWAKATRRTPPASATPATTCRRCLSLGRALSGSTRATCKWLTDDCPARTSGARSSRPGKSRRRHPPRRAGRPYGNVPIKPSSSAAHMLTRSTGSGRSSPSMNAPWVRSADWTSATAACS